MPDAEPLNAPFLVLGVLCALLTCLIVLRGAAVYGNLLYGFNLLSLITLGGALYFLTNLRRRA